MSDTHDVSLRDGTLVRHKHKGYEGTIEGITSIKACFTRGGVALQASGTKETFQYRVSVAGESLRQIAPLEDLEIVDAAAETKCVACGKSFYTKPGLVGKPSGRCVCGGWICPACMGCQTEEAARNQATGCTYQRKRLSKKAASEKRAVARTAL